MAILATLPRTSAKKAPTITARFTPAQRGHGEMELAENGRKTTFYRVSEFHAGRGYGIGRAFRVEKIVHDFDTPNEVYHCFLAKNQAERSCSCRGFEATGRCKHMAALALIQERGGLDAEDAGIPKAEAFGEWAAALDGNAERIAEIERLLKANNTERLCGDGGLDYATETKLECELAGLKAGVA